MTSGTIIVLNGTSSAGKTSLAAAFQRLHNQPFMQTGFDSFMAMLSEKYMAFNSSEGNIDAKDLYWSINAIETEPSLLFEFVLGSLGRQLIRGTHRAVAALALAGNNVIYDDLIPDQDMMKDWLIALQGFRVIFVGVHCPVEICEQRERDRGDRQVGFARSWLPFIHAHAIYDLEVDTSVLSPEDCAQQIIHYLESSTPTAFDQLREKLL